MTIGKLILVVLFGIGFWTLIFSFAPHPWKFLCACVVSTILMVVRCCIDPIKPF